ncbi:hypothetical protein OKW50_001316 [Paraburkholderia youngii]
MKREMSGMKAIAPASMPHENMIRAIQRRAPNRSSSRFDGTSKKKYARKNTPAPKPNALADRSSALFICKAAKPTFTRSR